MDWFRVEVSDRQGLIVAIESESLAGRDIGPEESAVIRKAIGHLNGFVGDAHVNAALLAALEAVIEYAALHADQERAALDHPRNAEYLDGIDRDVAQARAAIAAAAGEKA